MSKSKNVNLFFWAAMSLILIRTIIGFFWEEPTNVEKTLDILQAILIIIALFIAKPWRTYMDD